MRNRLVWDPVPHGVPVLGLDFFLVFSFLFFLQFKKSAPLARLRCKSSSESVFDVLFSSLLFVCFLWCCYPPPPYIMSTPPPQGRNK